MKIILGVFGQSYGDLRDEHDAVEFYDEKWIRSCEEHINNPFPHKEFYNNICINLDVCTKCVFDITHLKLPFNSKVTTLNELYIVIHNDEYFNKTEFYVNSQIINKNKLKELFLINEPIEFKDYAELFNQN